MGFTDKRFLLKHMVIHDTNREKLHICRVRLFHWIKTLTIFYDDVLFRYVKNHFMTKELYRCTHSDILLANPLNVNTAM
jgi:hypothetical protein